MVTYQEDGTAVVEIDEAKREETLKAAETTNIVDIVANQSSAIYPSYANDTVLKTGEEILNEIGQVVIQEYEIDELSRKKWIENAVADIKLFKAYMEPKSFPWPNCSNVHLPFLTTAVIQFHARAYEALVPAKGVVQVLNTEIPGLMKPEQAAAKAARADRVEKYMNYQLLYDMEEFEEGTDKMLIELPVTGNSFKKTFYDSMERKVLSKFVTSFDVCFNYGYNNMNEAQRVSQIIIMYPNDIRKRVEAGIFHKVAWDMKSGATTTFNQTITQKLDEIDGVKDNVITDIRPRVLIEQHRNWDFDGNGIAEPYVITVDYETRKVVRITDRAYYDDHQQLQTIQYFTHYTFLPNPTGGYAIGFGALMRGLNESAISLVNEVIDAGTLANLGNQSGFITKRSGIKKGSLTFKMGEFKEVETYIDDIRKAIYTFDFKGPNNTLYAVLGLLYEYSKLVASVSETMTGQLPASDTPATTVMALLEEGRKVFSSIHKRIHRAFKKELRKIYRLNSIFLDSTRYFQVLSEGGVPTNQMMQVAREDFSMTYDVIPVSDPSIISRAEKVIKAQHTREIIMSDPISARNPQNIYVATKRFLEAIDTPSIDEIYSPPQQNKPQDIPPDQENAKFISEQPSEVLPQQDHEQHLAIHSDLQTGIFAPEMTPAGKHILEAHVQQHKAGMYLNMKAKRQNTL